MSNARVSHGLSAHAQPEPLRELVRGCLAVGTGPPVARSPRYARVCVCACACGVCVHVGRVVHVYVRCVYGCVWYMHVCGVHVYEVCACVKCAYDVCGVHVRGVRVWGVWYIHVHGEYVWDVCV